MLDRYDAQMHQGRLAAAGWTVSVAGGIDDAQRTVVASEGNRVATGPVRPSKGLAMFIQVIQGQVTDATEAREGERKESPPNLRAQMEEMDKLSAEAPRFYDLKQPWLYSPR
jgi:hypothetical protein